MNQPGDKRLRIAVVGAGVAGLTAAHLLQRRHDVVLFEKNDYAGGHTRTIVVPDGPDAGTAVDTGFIVMNHRNYPLLTKLLGQLGVALADSDMSFGYHDEGTGIQYAGTDLNTLFAQHRNLLRPSFYRMIGDVVKFYREAKWDLQRCLLGDQTLGEYLARGRYSRMFVEHHLLPMGSALWSTPCDKMLGFPAESFIRFFNNHGLLSLDDRPPWKTVVGGAHTYVKKMEDGFVSPVRLTAGVEAVTRGDGRVTVRAGDRDESFDRVVIAAHADEALALLADPSHEEKRLLGAWVYERNHVVVHTDAGVMPPNRRAWASWNYTREKGAGAGTDRPLSLTYHMNRLQNLRTREQYFVSLNRSHPVEASRVIHEMDFTHPTFTFASMGTQKQLADLNGRGGTYYCGSYFGHGFHEDAVRSAVEVAGAMGVAL